MALDGTVPPFQDPEIPIDWWDYEISRMTGYHLFPCQICQGIPRL